MIYGHATKVCEIFPSALRISFSSVIFSHLSLSSWFSNSNDNQCTVTSRQKSSVFWWRNDKIRYIFVSFFRSFSWELGDERHSLKVAKTKEDKFRCWTLKLVRWSQDFSELGQNITCNKHYTTYKYWEREISCIWDNLYSKYLLYLS